DPVIGERVGRAATGSRDQQPEGLYERYCCRVVLHRSCADMEGPGSPVRSTDTHVLVCAAVVETWSPRQAAAPVGGVGNLPATDDSIQAAADAPGKSLPSAYW